MEAGLDSLGAVELRNALNERFGAELSTTFMFDYPTMAAMAAHIHSVLVERTSAELDQAAGPATGSRRRIAAVDSTDIFAAVNAVLEGIAGVVGPDQVSLPHHAASRSLLLIFPSVSLAAILMFAVPAQSTSV